MKIRLDFVTNSSSSNYTIRFFVEDEDGKQVQIFGGSQDEFDDGTASDVGFCTEKMLLDTKYPIVEVPGEESSHLKDCGEAYQNSEYYCPPGAKLASYIVEGGFPPTDRLESILHDFATRDERVFLGTKQEIIKAMTVFMQKVGMEPDKIVKEIVEVSYTALGEQADSITHDIAEELGFTNPEEPTPIGKKWDEITSDEDLETLAKIFGTDLESMRFYRKTVVDDIPNGGWVKRYEKGIYNRQEKILMKKVIDGYDAPKDLY